MGIFQGKICNGKCESSAAFLHALQYSVLTKNETANICLCKRVFVLLRKHDTSLFIDVETKDIVSAKQEGSPKTKCRSRNRGRVSATTQGEFHDQVDAG
jgi:hypothetical protein